MRHWNLALIGIVERVEKSMRSVLFTAAVALAVVGHSVDAARGDVVGPGTKIGVDLGPTPTTNWNNFPTNASIASGSVVKLSGNVLTGVSLTLSGVAGFNNDGTDNWGGLASNGGPAPPEFVDSVVTDLGFRNNVNDIIQLVINGLNPTLYYSVSAVTTSGPPPLSRVEHVVLTGATTMDSFVFRPETLAPPWPFHAFPLIQPSAGGTLTLQVFSSPANPILNGVLITVPAAVPEASALALTGLVGAGVGLIVWRRRG